jgi:hypothetical protein
MGWGVSRKDRDGRTVSAAEPPPVMSERSPFHEAVTEERVAKIVNKITPTGNGMGMLTLPSGTTLRVRIACGCWAPDHGSNDCRNGCGAKGR